MVAERAGARHRNPVAPLPAGEKAGGEGPILPQPRIKAPHRNTTDEPRRTGETTPYANAC